MYKTQTTIKLVTYDCQFTCIITDSLNEQVNRIYKKHKSSYRFIDSAEGVLFSLDIDKYYLVIDKKYLTHNTIAHEIFHAACRITKDRGIKDEEAQAWLCGHLSRVIYKFLNKKKFVIKHG
jgi:hypothetical protein